MNKNLKEDKIYLIFENRRKYKYYFIKKIIKYKKFGLFLLIIFLLFIIAYFLLIKWRKKIFILSKNNSTYEKDITYRNIFNKKNNKIKVCLCVIGKEENLYIKEFVTHYKNLGYDHIFLYDNNDVNGEKFEDVIQEEINENFVSIINYRGYSSKYLNAQLFAYYFCYERYKRDFDWLSFFDIDEYLYINNTNISIQDFFDNKRYEKCQQIKINWLIYSDNDFLKYENKTLKERFTKESIGKLSNRHIKATVRGSLPSNYWANAKNPHSTIYNVFKACTSSGIKISSNKSLIIPDYEFAHLKHYTTKTIEEYCNKIKRGKATREFIINEKNLKDRFDLFFEINRKTKEKVDYFNNFFNTSFI